MRINRRIRANFDKAKVTEQVYLQLLDDLDDERQTSADDLLQILRFVSHNALSEIFEQHQLTKEIRKELEERACLYLPEEIKEAAD